MLPFMILVSMHNTELYQKLFCQIIIIFFLVSTRINTMVVSIESIDFHQHYHIALNILSSNANWYDKWENKYFDRFPIKHPKSLSENFCLCVLSLFKIILAGYAASITNTYKQSQWLMTLQKYGIDKQLNVEQIRSKMKVNVGKDIITTYSKKKNKS